MVEPSPQFRLERGWHKGGQGTLFKPLPSAIPDAKRYPRGYTPERQAEVMTALRHPSSDSHGNDDPVIRPVHEIGPDWHPDVAGVAKQMNAHHERGVIDAIARSTVPAHHLTERTQGTYKNQEGQMRLGHVLVNDHMATDGGAEPHTAAYFNSIAKRWTDEGEQTHDANSIVMRDRFGEHRTSDSPSRQYRGNGGRGVQQTVSLHADNERAKTLIHELGHHDSHADDDWEASMDRRDYRDPIVGGAPAEEGYADNYADKHYRMDPRTRGARRTTDAHYNSDYAQLLGHHEEYREQRPNPSSAADAERIHEAHDWAGAMAARAARSRARRHGWQQGELF